MRLMSHSPNDLETARHHLALVRAARARLAEEYARPHYRREVVAQLHHDIGVHLKLAQVHADLAQAVALGVSA